MKKLFIIIIIFISFQTLSKADDIKDFQIEGVSIGDSALDFYDVNKINSWQKIFYPSDVKFFKVDTQDTVGDYDDMGFHFKTNDSKFI